MFSNHYYDDVIFPEYDIEIVTVTCYCGASIGVMPNNEREALSYRCPGCKSTIFQVRNREEDDKYIDYIMSQQI